MAAALFLGMAETVLGGAEIAEEKTGTCTSLLLAIDKDGKT